MRTERRKDLAAALACAALAWLTPACSAVPAEVAPEQLAAEEQRLLRPFQQDLAVVADAVAFELSPNFDAELARPATGPGGGVKRRVEDGAVVYQWVSTGGVQEPLRFQLGQLRLAALRSATLRVRGSGALALDCIATGNVSVLAAGAGAQSTEYQELRIHDGQLRTR